MKRMLILDIFVIIIFVMMLGTRLATNFYVSYMAETTGAKIEAIAAVYEVSPVARALLNLRSLNYAINMLLLPSFVMGVYWIFRRAVKKGQMAIVYLEFFVTIIFMVMLLNLLNDWSILIGKWIRI